MKKTVKRVRVNLKLLPAVHAALREQCRKKGVTIQKQLETLVIESLR